MLIGSPFDPWTHKEELVFKGRATELAEIQFKGYWPFEPPTSDQWWLRLWGMLTLILGAGVSSFTRLYVQKIIEYTQMSAHEVAQVMKEDWLREQ